MEIVRRPLVVLGTRVYRKNPVKEDRGSSTETTEVYYTDFPADEPSECLSLEETDKGFRTSLHIPSALCKHIVGKKGETRRRIEQETKTQISIPGPGVEGETVISGKEQAGVNSACTRLEVISNDARKRQPATHFLSLPMATPALQEAFCSFQKDVLSNCSECKGVDSTIFQRPNRLHLTLGVLTLLSPREMEQAIKCLNATAPLIRDIVGDDPLSVSICGVEYMNDDPAMVDVLYGKVRTKDGSDRLQQLANELVSHFSSIGFLKNDFEQVKLHVTLLNTTFRKKVAQGVGSKTSKVEERHCFKDRESFDARQILKRLNQRSFWRGPPMVRGSPRPAVCRTSL
uniref:activating signal cointegrator 1 complex subunit 1 isoform X2 n=1 Tax=Myxine glutinosa TaxID=7769 RepID=UPI0035901D80